MTREEAIAFHDSRAWESMTLREIAEFQINEERLCIPFSVFHEAIEKTLGRPVFTHEFGLNLDGLRAELFDGKPAPTLEQIVDMVPEEKRVVLVVPTDGVDDTTP